MGTNRITIIAKNAGGTDVYINDLGQVIPAAGQITISTNQNINDIYESDDLYSLVTAGVLVLNDGIADLIIADAQNFLRPYNKVEVVDTEVTASDIIFAAPSRERDFQNLIYSTEGAALYVSEFDSRTTRRYKFYIDFEGSTDNVSLRLWDSVNLIVLGELTGISANGMYEIIFTQPTSETEIDIQLKKDTNNSGNPVLESGIFIYES